MTKYLLAAAVAAAIGFAGAAYGGDATTPKAMSDNEMDKVTAGDIPSEPHVFTFNKGVVLNSKPNDHANINGFQGFRGSDIAAERAAHCFGQGC
jgi:hypothetical protein